VRAHNMLLVPALVIALSILALAPATAFAYIGPGPGLEFVPFFMSLLTWIAVALGGVLLWPITALLSRFRRPAQTQGVTPANAQSDSPRP
jgi:hypothetical protein